MEIWIRLIQGQNLKLRCRGFAMFFCGDAVFVIFFRSVAVWTVPQCPPHYYIIILLYTVLPFCLILTLTLTRNKMTMSLRLYCLITTYVDYTHDRVNREF